MVKRLFLLFVLNAFLFPLVGNSQTTIRRLEKRPYMASIESRMFDTPIVGSLYEVNDSSIVLLRKVTSSRSTLQHLQFNYDEINTLRLKRKNSVAMGIFLGFLGGFLLGEFVGLSAFEDDECQSSGPILLQVVACSTARSKEYKALSLAVGLGIGGGLIGGLIGTQNDIFLIHHDYNRWAELSPRITRYAIIQ